MEYIIKTENLTKNFGKLTAVNSINLNVPKGSIFALLGPNGAGKTTTIRLLNGVLRPSSGTAFLFGRNIQKDGSFIRERCGVQTDTNLYDMLSTSENLKIWGKLFGLRGNHLSKRVSQLLEMFGLDNKKTVLAGSLSKGMKQKLSIARAIIHDPEILFLDEPTAGLDPEATEDVLLYLERCVQANQNTVFLCSHRLEEVERLSRLVAILFQGKVLASGTIEDLAGKIWKDKWVYCRLAEEGGQAVEALKRAGREIETSGSPGYLKIKIKDSSEIPAVVGDLVKNGARILSVQEEVHSLKDIYLTLVPQERNEHTAH